jgi:CheY-like chemotaxis protein
MAKILVIDDNPDLVKVIAAVLHHAGHVTVTAVNGREALRVIGDSQIDVVLTDLIMPEMDGIEVIMALRQRFIAMSGGGRLSATDLLSVASRLGASQTLSKPVSSPELLAAIRTVLAPAASPAS